MKSLKRIQKMRCTLRYSSTYVRIPVEFTTTATAAIKLLLGLPSRHLVVDKEAMAASHMLFTKRFKLRFLRTGHHRIIFGKLKQNPVLKIPSDKTPLFRTLLFLLIFKYQEALTAKKNLKITLGHWQNSSRLK